MTVFVKNVNFQRLRHIDKNYKLCQTVKTLTSFGDAMPAPKLTFFETLSLMKEVFFNGAHRTPKLRLPEVKPDFVSFVIPNDEMKFIWFGHSSILLNLDSEIILIDPVFSGSASPFSFLIKRFQPPVAGLDELPHVDTIVISHDHYDHLDKESIKHFVSKTTKFIVPAGVGLHLQNWGIPKSRIKELSWGERAVDNGITYTATPAQHFSGRGLFDKNKTEFSSWVIQGKNEKIFYSGDSGYGDHFRKIGLEHSPFDYAFIENGQYNVRWPLVHMQPEETIQALIDLDAHTLIPVHWGMFDLSLHHWSEPIMRTHEIAMNWEIPIITPKLGETVTFLHRNENWWTSVIEQENKLQSKALRTPQLALE